MKERLTRIFQTYFGTRLDLRVQAFHLLAFVGMASGAINALFAPITNAGTFNHVLNIIGSFIGLGCFIFARRTGRYRIGFVAAVVLTFIILFPLLFFSAGGYHSGMPCFFIFAIVFTTIMLEGKIRKIFVASEFILYAACFVIAYLYPNLVNHFETEFDFFLDSLTMGVIVAGLMLVAVVILYIRIYDNRQKRLEELDKLKTEFIQNMNHEMKTPLTVIESYINNANDMLDHDVDKSEVQVCLENAQEQIENLARLVGYSISVAAAQEAMERMEPLDFATLLHSSAGVFNSLLKETGNTLSMQIPDGAPKITGNADALRQVAGNLLFNAAKHTRNGAITITLTWGGNQLTTVIADTGEGIDSDLLPRVFDRGVSGNESTTGYGLSICKAIVEMHGGEINIDSESGKGTAVSFTLPVQREGAL